MKFKIFTKKIAAAITGATVAATLAMPVQPAEAFLSEAINIGATIASASAQRKALKKEIDRLSNTEEGRQSLYQLFREKQGVNTNSGYNSRLNTLMKNLTDAVAKVDPTVRDKPYLYFVSADESINAACALGRIMLVNAGTFANMPNDDEIAAIVGHEMGHGQSNHAAKSVMKNLDKQTMAQIGVTAAGAGGNLAGIAANLAGNIALQQSIAHGSRKFETEADNLAFDYILHTQYNPGACAAVMQRFVDLMGDKEKQRSNGLSSLLNPSDHPDSDKRRDNYLKKLYAYSGNKVSEKDGAITINKKHFIIVAPANSMSGPERACFVLGNLATAFHRGQDKKAATVQNGTVMLGNQPIITPAEGDEDAQTIADRLNSIK